MQLTKEEKTQKVITKKTDTALVDIIKRMNGFKDSHMKQIQKIQTIELVLEDFGAMHVVNKFKGLKSLTLINCGIASIQGLQDATRLQYLWLNQNQITKIQGLDKCVSLKNLYLSHNSIKVIQGLQNLTSLETLWICDNKIETLDRLDNLVNLKQLWVAGNNIDSIKTSLDSLVNLTDLNISGNKICSFKQVLNLNRLPNLKILSFYDPHFGQNPICNLCNYQTYVLYHLRNIIKLDTLAISQEAKAFAESTLMRKKMYYNMRIKTIQRTFSTLSKLAQKASKIKLDGLNEDLANLFLKINDIGQQITKTKQLKQIYSLKKQEINHIENVYEAVTKKLRQVNKISIRKLLTQFETGGNIRLEQGKPTDKWLRSCKDLMATRFSAQDLQKYDINGINITKVVRIHNRFLKNKFQQKMEMLADISSVNSKKQLEYLFYGIDPNVPSQLEHVIQEGFRSPEEAKKLGICPFVPLFNTILGVDLPRISHLVEVQQKNNKLGKNFISKRNLGNLTLLPTGSLLICKVLMVKQQIDSQIPFFDPNIPPSELFRKGKVNFQEGHYASCRTYNKNLTQNNRLHKMWFVMDHNLVIPQYLVQYEYVLNNPNQNRIADFNQTVALLQTNDDQFISAKNIATYQKDINNIYNMLVEQISGYQFESIQQKNNPNLQIQASDLDRFDIGNLKVMLVNYFKYCLSRSNLYYELNQNLLFEGTQQFDIKKLSIEDPSVLQFANLSNLKIKYLPFISSFVNLQVLVISYNQLVNLVQLQNLKNLKKLDVSHNRITTLAGISSLKLEHLDISHNSLSSEDSLSILQLAGDTLKQINVLFNPFEDQHKIRLKLAKILPNLQWLNHCPKSKFAQIQKQQQNINQITDDLMKQNCKIMQSKTLDSIDWKLSIQSVNLTHMKLSSMRGLQGLVNLRQLNLSNNQITVIQYIDNCKLLQQLNLQKNLITKISHIDGLIFLKKVQLGKNKISEVQGISTLNNLKQLSLEDNQIQTLEGFPQLLSLMELYIGNNKISDSKHIKYLAGLTKLIILDLSGNPISKQNSYRFYTVYLLKKLKVLDGISIENPEHQQAKQHFTGRLTEQILKQNLRGRLADQIKQLQLKGCKLKDFEQTFNAKTFPKLQELDLSNNQFSSVKMIGHMPNLKILILQSNKIQTLYYNNDLSVQKGLNGCQNLQILDLSMNILKDFYGLHLCKLGQLKILKASKNQIIKIDCLQNLKQLKQLDVHHNKIRQFDPNSFEGKLPIKCLKIDDNGLKNFQNIQKLLRLQHLFANSNKITQFFDIEKLTELPYLKQLELVGNILYRKPGYRITMIKKLPGLLFLDGRQITQQQRAQPSSMNIQSNIPQLYQQQQQMQPPQMQMQMQMNANNANSRHPVRLSSVNFQGVFTSSRMNMQSLINQNLYNQGNQQPPRR